MSEKKGTNKFVKVAIIAGVVIIPLLYSYFYLKAFWDPYARLSDVPVAVANLDKGAEINDVSRNVGSEICDELKKDGTVKFDFTSEEAARKGVLGNKYYAAIIIPENLSDSISTVSKDTDKIHGEITYIANQKKNYLAAQIIENAMPKIKESVNGKIDEEIIGTLCDKLNGIPDEMGKLQSGLGQISDGQNALADGAKTLHDGTKKLNSGNAKLALGINQYTAGVSSATAGAGTLMQGISVYTNGVQTAKLGADSLYQGINTANIGLGKISSGVSASLDYLNKNASDENLDKLDQSASTFNQSVKTFGETYEAAMKSLEAYQQSGNQKDLQTAAAYFTALSKNIPSLTGGASALQGGINSLTNGMRTVKTNTGELSAGLAQLQAGFGDKQNPQTLVGGSYALTQGLSQLTTNSPTLNAGSKALNDGLNTLSKNNKTLNNGIAQAKNGSKALNDGAGALSDGANKLKSGVEEAKTGVDESIDDTNNQLKALVDLPEYGKEPVKTDTEFIQPVANYGSAFAPYFMGLSLWVGGLMIFFGIYLDYNKKIKSLTKDSNSPAKRQLYFVGISSLQGIMLAVVIKYILGITVEHTALLFFSCWLVSLVFMAIIQFCITNLGDVGKFVALLLLILQLTSCAGTFPIETQASFFRVINEVLPMTYSTLLFKEAISGVAGGMSTKYIIILLGYLLLFLVVSELLRRKQKRSEEKRLAKEENMAAFSH